MQIKKNNKYKYSVLKQLHLVGMLVFSFNESSRGAAVALPIDPCCQPIAMPKNPYSKLIKVNFKITPVKIRDAPKKSTSQNEINAEAIPSRRGGYTVTR